MKAEYICLRLVTLALTPALGRSNKVTSPPSREYSWLQHSPNQTSSLADNPCAVLNPEQVSAITGLEVTTAKRLPSIDKIVRAQNENREPDPGTIWSYETRSNFGSIMIVVPVRKERSAAEYWKRYCQLNLIKRQIIKSDKNILPLSIG